MRGVSNDIEIAVNEVIKGLRYNINIDTTDDDDLKSAMHSKGVAFDVTKNLIHKWQNSPNAPSKAKLKKTIKSVVLAGDEALVNLREALRKTIDYDSLKPNAINTAIAAKPVIYDTLFKIESGVFDFRRQLETGKINVQDEEFRIGIPEKFANGEVLDISKHFKNWYNEKDDAVKICPFGTEGKIIEIEGLKIQLPKPPRDPDDILFSDLPKEEQYWRRTEPPTGITKETINQFLEWIYEEFRRRVEGVWFMNNGVPTYLTGDMYFALQYCRMLDDGWFMNFRIPQANIFYFLQACIVDTRCLGDLFEKSRRTGFTYIALFIVLNRITMKKNQKAGITSKTDKDAEEAFLKFSYAFLNLPFYFRPVVKGRQESNVRLEFAKPPDASKAAKKAEDINVEKYLNSMIDYRASVDGSYDSIQLNWYIADEVGKRHKGHNIIKHLGQVTPTMKKGGRIVGKLFAGSTVGEKDKGGDNMKLLADGSDVRDRNKTTGRTSTFLYRHALFAHENHEMHIDNYGYCHIKKPSKPTYNIFGELIMNGSLEYIKAEADSLRSQGDDLYNEFLRANPLTRGDMYRVDSGKNKFNHAKITEQNIYNNDLPRDFVMRGNFVWNNAEQDTHVVWNPDPNGKFYVSWLPKPEDRNKKVKVNGKWYPLNAHIGRGGVDSFDIDKTVDGQASNGAVSFITMYNLSDNTPNNHFVLEYCERPSYREIFYEDTLMAAIFFGFPLLIENNKREIISYIQDRGYGGYVMRRPKEYTPESNIKRKLVEWGVPSNSKEIIRLHEAGIERYIHYHVGDWTEANEFEENQYGRSGERPVGSCGSMLFSRTLDDWTKFDVTNRTKFDLTISSGYAIMATKVSFRDFNEYKTDSKTDDNYHVIKKLARKYTYVNGKPQRLK